ncbi:TPA: hypothetical protein ACGUTO_004556 [Vibrio vulnificus]|nr:hypothetical protein [Vibrio vulnificus]HDY7901626.1 hypothetical protein [Vibrio vulnificus]HDY7942708.1 hypothetical protein [Vibrio vulnificus]
MSSNDSYFLALENRGLEKVKTQWLNHKHGRPESKNWYLVKHWIEQQEQKQRNIDSSVEEALTLKGFELSAESNKIQRNMLCVLTLTLFVTTVVELITLLRAQT